MSDAAAPEFSRMVDPRKLTEGAIVLEPDEGERSALARRFDLVSVDSMRAEVVLDPDGNAVAARGTLEAQIVQSCAVSGEDLPARIAEDISLRFVPENSLPTPDEEIELTADQLDEIEYRGDRFDLGEAVAQTLGLAIDPFAEGPGAEEARKAGLVSSSGASGPFAALAALKKE